MQIVARIDCLWHLAQMSELIDQELRDAARDGDVVEVTTLLARGANAKAADIRGDTALILAAQRGHAACVKELLPHSDPEARGKVFISLLTDRKFGLDAVRDEGQSEVGYTALMQAALNGHAEVVNALLPVSDARAVCGAIGETPLMLAAQGGHTTCVKALLPGSDPLARTRSRGHTALTMAAEIGHRECVRLLLAVSDANAQPSPSLDTPLMSAVRNWDMEMIDVLLPYSDVSLRNSQGWGASCFARAGGEYALADLIDAYPRLAAEMQAIASAIGPAGDEAIPSPKRL